MYLVAILFNLCLGFNTLAINPSQYQDKAKELTNCYYNWRLTEANFQDSNFTPMIWKPTNKNLLTVGELVIKYPGRTWLVYNEPEGKDQANTTPEVAATWFEQTYKLIKNLDPTAKVGCCGNMVRQESFDWLESFIQNTNTKPDFWHIHVYAFDGKTTTWKNFIDYWWYWNSKNWNLNTSITETCGMNSENQVDLLNFVSSYQHPKLLSIYWFSAYEESLQWNCHLLNNDGSLTTLGNEWVLNLPTKLTPQPEPTIPLTPTPTATPIAILTRIPTNTPVPLPSVIATLIPTSTPTQEPTDLKPIIEPTLANPIILFEFSFLPIVFN